jgi:hypothetical protein
MLQPGERVRTTRELRHVLPDLPIPDDLADTPATGTLVRRARAGDRDEQRGWLVRLDGVDGEHEIAETALTPLDVPPL